MAGVPITGDFGIEMPLTVVPPKTRGTKRVWYKPNHRSFGAFMRSDQMRDVTEQVAKAIAKSAAAATPKSKSGAGLHSRVKGGFTVQRDAGLMKVSGNLRVRVDVENDEEGAALVEFGARNITRQRMLGRAGAEFGDFKPEGGPQ